jgi:excisionase family DNA binding protein
MAKMSREQAAYSQTDAAAMLGVSVSTLRRMIKARHVRTVRVGGRRQLIPREELERVLTPGN